MPQPPTGITSSVLVTSHQRAVLPFAGLVIPQSATPCCMAGSIFDERDVDRDGSELAHVVGHRGAEYAHLLALEFVEGTDVALAEHDLHRVRLDRKKLQLVLLLQGPFDHVPIGIDGGARLLDREPDARQVDALHAAGLRPRDS